MRSLFVVSIVVSILFLYGNYGMAHEKKQSACIGGQCEGMIKLVPDVRPEKEVPTLAPRQPVRNVLKRIAEATKKTKEKDRKMRKHIRRHWRHRWLIRYHHRFSGLHEHRG